MNPPRCQIETIGQCKAAVSKLHDRVKAQNEKQKVSKETIGQLSEQLAALQAQAAQIDAEQVAACVYALRSHAQLDSEESLGAQLSAGIAAVVESLSSIKAENLSYLMRMSEMEQKVTESASELSTSLEAAQALAKVQA